MPAPDRSLGVYETLLVRDGAVQALSAHLVRLRRSLHWLYGLAPPGDLAARIRERAARLGDGEHRLRVDARPAGDSLALAFQTAALAPRPPLFRLRPLTFAGGYGAHKLADRRPLANASSRSEAPVALLVDGTGPDAAVLEAAWANVWLLAGERLLTPPLDGRILPGVTRARVIAHASALGLTVSQEPITLARAADGTAASLLSSSLQLAAAAAWEDGAEPRCDVVETIGRIRAALLATDWE